MPTCLCTVQTTLTTALAGILLIAVGFDVFLSGILCVLGCVSVVAVRQVRVVGCFLMMSGFVMLRSFVVVVRSMLMMLGRLLVMMGCFL